MDATLANALAPVLAMLALGIIPTSLVFITKYFKLKTRELDLESELHGRELGSRLAAMEARQQAMESALTAIANGFAAAQQQRNEPMRASLAEPPPLGESSHPPSPVRKLPER